MDILREFSKTNEKIFDSILNIQDLSYYLNFVRSLVFVVAHFQQLLVKSEHEYRIQQRYRMFNTEYMNLHMN